MTFKYNQQYFLRLEMSYLQRAIVIHMQHFGLGLVSNTFANTPVSSYDGFTSLCWRSSVNEARKVFVNVNGGTDAA